MNYSPEATQSAALIVAGGSSVRFGHDKLTALVHGEPLICYSLRAFANGPSITSIILVVPPKREEEFSLIMASMNFPELTAMTKIVTGGKTRHESVQRGIAALPPSVCFVAIHDAARPLITSALIERCLKEARRYGAASLATPVTDTLHRANADGFAEKTVDRNNLWAMQTPQVFRVADLKKCLTEQQYETTLKPLFTIGAADEGQDVDGPQKLKGLTVRDVSSTDATKPITASTECEDRFSPTDEVSALLKKGVAVHLVENSEPNIKVTYPGDLKLVTAILKAGAQVAGSQRTDEKIQRNSDFLKRKKFW